MKVAMVSPLEMKVPPVGYGGVELVVSLLTEELVRRGHDVTLFASGDSVTSGKLGLHSDGLPDVEVRPPLPRTPALLALLARHNGLRFRRGASGELSMPYRYLPIVSLLAHGTP